MDSLCEECPLRVSCPEPAIMTWAWFDMVVDRSTGIMPSSEHDAPTLLKNAAAQAEIIVGSEQHNEQLLAMQGLITCFIKRQAGGCGPSPEI